MQNPFRNLDIDDLLILVHFKNGLNQLQIANELNVSQAAISHRLNSIRYHIGDVTYMDGRCLKLTDRGDFIATHARKFLEEVNL